jgi:hypothetical protein
MAFWISVSDARAVKRHLRNNRKPLEKPSKASK